MFPKNLIKVFILLGVCLFSCHQQKKEAALFTALEEDKTGLSFVNSLKSTSDFNIFNYMYYYNGGGIGAGDFNNDGKIDVFFASNLGKNTLYLNEGKLRFRDISSESGIPETGSWNTGVSVVDINNDGLLDIYICCVGNLNNGHHTNQLLVCTGIDAGGIPHYKEEAKEYGLDFTGYSTQAVFFDYDGDGDLDMFLLNHTVHETGSFGNRKILSGKFNPLTGDRIFRNDHNHYTDITPGTGIYHSVIGYGLGVCVSDINMDGYPDVYIGNDFHENDYLYINQHNGTFKEEVEKSMMHTSQFSMGVDIADVNNDGYPEIISMDMMPNDRYILKRSLGENDYDTYYEKLGYGYNYQYTRNNLQYNRKNGMFSEVGVYSGVFATDWSWSALWMDFNNDGLKDLFISNGIPKRMNDIDFINYVSNDVIQQKIQNHNLTETDFSLLDKFPEIKIPNKFYLNQGKLVFKDLENQVENNLPTFSNGAVYADFDNDGKLDILVNNINDKAILYHNIAGNQDKGHISSYVDIILKGDKENLNALGSKIVLYIGNSIRTYEKYPVHGFMSSMEIPVHIGLENTKIDSAFLIWPDNSFQKIHLEGKQHRIHFSYTKGLAKFNYTWITEFVPNKTLPVKEISHELGLNFAHLENNFQEFNREALIPRMFSTEGPALAIGDMNGDGMEDVFIGGSRDHKSALFVQEPNGKFIRSHQPGLDQDSSFEDIGACWMDINKDGYPDLVIASGGNEFFGEDPHLMPRVYMNNKEGILQRNPEAFPKIYMNASCAVSYDWNQDGYPDVFLGGRSVPYNYGEIPRSYLFQNDGKGKFVDKTEEIAPGLSKLGFITQALWFDLDQNGEKDLLIAQEWGGIIAYMNHHGHFTQKVLSDKKGWWNFILPVDLNGDGKLDLVVGNQGLNNRFKDASPETPVRMYYNDFDDNGKKEQVLTYYLYGKEIPFAEKGELERQMPVIKKHFLYAEDFAKADLDQIFSPKKLSESALFKADYFSSAILWNQGNMEFKTQALPWEAQLSPLRDGVVLDANGDGLPDVLLMGNYYENNIQMGRYDADFGTLLINQGKGKMKVENLNGLAIKGQVRHIGTLNTNGKKSYLLVKNNDTAQVIQFQKSK